MSSFCCVKALESIHFGHPAVYDPSSGLLAKNWQSERSITASISRLHDLHWRNSPLPRAVSRQYNVFATVINSMTALLASLMHRRHGDDHPIFSE
jgi:hypothetical protein